MERISGCAAGVKIFPLHPMADQHVGRQQSDVLTRNDRDALCEETESDPTISLTWRRVAPRIRACL
jgi:hypothetical protein